MKRKMTFNGVILTLELQPLETDRDTGTGWRNGLVSFDGPDGTLKTIEMGGGWIHGVESANQANEEAGIAGGLRQGVSYPNETIPGQYQPYEFGEDCSGWEETLMPRIFGDDWSDDEDSDDNRRDVFAAVQKELSKLAE